MTQQNENTKFKFYKRPQKFPERNRGSVDPGVSAWGKHRTQKESRCKNSKKGEQRHLPVSLCERWLIERMCCSFPAPPPAAGAQLSENSHQGIGKKKGDKPGGLCPQTWLKNMGPEEDTKRGCKSKIAYLLG